MDKSTSNSTLSVPNEPVLPIEDMGNCLRCHQPRPLDDDGFCDACRKALEEACL